MGTYAWKLISPIIPSFPMGHRMTSKAIHQVCQKLDVLHPDNGILVKGLKVARLIVLNQEVYHLLLLCILSIGTGKFHILLVKDIQNNIVLTKHIIFISCKGWSALQ